MWKRIAIPLEFDLASPAIARDEVRQLLADAPSEAEEAEVVVSELVTNAVVHGAAPIALELFLDHHRLRIEVCDGNPHVRGVVPGGAYEDASPRRGLRIVSALAQRWGVMPHPGGKLVWAEVSF